MSTEKVSLTLDHALRRQSQHDRLTGLLAELGREHGPIAPHVIEEVRRTWPAPGEKVVKHRDA